MERLGGKQIGDLTDSPRICTALAHCQINGTAKLFSRTSCHAKNESYVLLKITPSLFTNKVVVEPSIVSQTKSGMSLTSQYNFLPDVWMDLQMAAERYMERIYQARTLEFIHDI